MTLSDLPERVSSKITVTQSGCWHWTANKTRWGYGLVRWHSKYRTVHRLMFELAKGAIPAKLTIDHVCRNRACCNPEHLEAVTMRENVLRGTGPSAMNAVKTHCYKGHAFDDTNTIHRKSGERACQICAREGWRVRARRRRERHPEIVREANLRAKQRREQAKSSIA